ncbi:aminopeptidase [Intestinibacillus massiliensis]
MNSEQLFYDKKPGFDRLTDDGRRAIQDYAEGYKRFLDVGKTERDATAELVRQAEAHGFTAYDRTMQLHPGDKVYKVNRGKGVILAVIGQKSLAEGIRLTAAHLDAPRIDIRTVPLYEDTGMAYFKTHYYGGIKKYQWMAIPLELRGVVCVCKDGETRKAEVRIGDKPGDPKFVITDLLPHLASEQMAKKATEVVKGEGMNLLIGLEPSRTEDEKCSDKVKLAVMEYLNREYSMTEADFLSAELSAVPAWNACDIGFDRSMVGAYGHDDRVCSYPAATGLFALEGAPMHTAMALLVDKEEIGSDGVTGMQSRFFDTMMADLCRAEGVYPEVCYENSMCLSADVCNAYDPNFPEVSEKRNDGRTGCGLAIVKYTGSRGKSGTSDAAAELMARVRCILDGAGVVWQTAQLGRVDQGGGGTVAMFLANRNIDTVDAGVPVLSMHAPFEVIAKLDLYMAFQGFQAFYRA